MKRAVERARTKKNLRELMSRATGNYRSRLIASNSSTLARNASLGVRDLMSAAATLEAASASASRAEKMIVELKDKIGPVGLGDAGGAGLLAGAWQEQVRQGVLALGWSATQADQAVAAIGETIDGEVPPVPILLRQAIRLLGKSR